MTDFEKWWYYMGSGMRSLDNADYEEHAYRIASTAWLNAYEQGKQDMAKEILDRGVVI
jgi:hypothetical protein